MYTEPDTGSEFAHKEIEIARPLLLPKSVMGYSLEPESESSTAQAEAEADPETPFSRERQPSPFETEPPAPTRQRVAALRDIAHYAGLVPMAMFGTLIRLGLTALADYNGRIVFPLIWSQAIGCAIMGTALARKSELTEIYPPLYTALATGLAGSITTFSTWMLEGFEAFADIGGFARGGLRDVSRHR